ncbi:MAG: hypothetical protein KatS3mg015_2534 [Fimbriimonadales bacterium]|nr:MAG: hypothetical protein KatS3mg015_2534 [Fimbriimonadales bacterium]
MARKTVLISDLSGDPIAENDYARVTIMHGSSRYVLDVRVQEITNLIESGRSTKKPGRPKKNSA